MRYVKNDIQTTDTLANPAATLFCPDAVKFTLQVFNAAIVYQLGQGQIAESIRWELEEVALTPVVAQIFRNADAIRVRSKVVGTPALVHLEAIS